MGKQYQPSRGRLPGIEEEENMEKESGQAVVIVAFAMVALLLAVGLALDGGYLHASRRQAQNAADAAALAGTRLLADALLQCRPGSEADDAAVQQAVLDLASQNRVANDGQQGRVRAWYVDAEGNRLGEVGAGTIPHGATGVEVSLVITRPTTFMRVGGVNHFRVPSKATAMTGRIVQMAGGVLPIAVPLQVIESLEPDETFVVIETNQHHGGMFCRQDDGLCIGDPASANAHQGWLNLNYIYNTEHLSQSDPLYRTFKQSVPNRGCSPNPETSVDDGLKGWASGQCPYPFPIFAGNIGGTDGDFIHGEPGARQSSLMAISAFEGQIAYVPVFDYIYMSDYMAENFPQPEGIGWPRAGGGRHAFLYHIVGFAAVLVDDIQGHTLVGSFQEALIREGQILPDTGFGTAEWCSTNETPQLFGVSLWR
ncbi:MAG TPA: hypothetical protein EYP52_05340 [Anaerolineae bacterium]|nr:hypothetical protein [Anaerolineae bacterium]